MFMMILQNITLFPGCMISYRLPFIEVSVRKILEKFEIDFSENQKFSCCPEPNGIKNFDELTYSITAGRNLALAEAEHKNILTPCNGCFETLKGIRSEIKANTHFRDDINHYLGNIDLKVEGKSDVFHFVEFIHKLGKDTIKEKIVYPLNGLRVAVHYGYHFLRPSNKIQMDDPFEPHIFDELIEDLGATSVDYVKKLDCCGGSLSRADNPDYGLEMIQNKLENMKGVDIDVIVVGCPQCFIQYDHLQQDLKRIDYVYDIPVLYYSELLCIALGIDIKDMIKKYHRTPVESIFQKVNDICKKNELIKEHFDLKFLNECYRCGACNDDCPVAKVTDFNPNKIIGKILEGNLKDVISDPIIWNCLDCYACYELCPMRTGLVDIFTTLRNMASKNGFISRGFKAENDSFKKMGTVTMFSKSARSRVGLDSRKSEIEDLKKLLKKIEEEG